MTTPEPDNSADHTQLASFEGFLRAACKLVRKRNEKWWRDLHTGEPIERNVGELLCLQHSEVSEAVDTDKNVANLWELHGELTAMLRLAHLEADTINRIHANISAAMEGHRKRKMDDKLPERPMFEVELADAMIRIMDTAEGLGFDLAGAWRDKMEFNAVRKDHTTEARLAPDGKKY